MNIYLFLMALFIAPQLAFSNHENNNKKFSPPQLHSQKFNPSSSEFINIENKILPNKDKDELQALKNKLNTKLLKNEQLQNNHEGRFKKLFALSLASAVVRSLIPFFGEGLIMTPFIAIADGLCFFSFCEGWASLSKAKDCANNVCITQTKLQSVDVALFSS